MNKFLVTGALLLLVSCQPESGVLGPVPAIELVEVNPLTVVERQDPITFTLSYEDGDGDLGENDDAVRNVFVTDNRIGTIHEFRLQELAPAGSEIAISGTFTIELPQTIMTTNESSETVTFTLSVQDRAGNESNEVTTPEITVTR